MIDEDLDLFFDDFGVSFVAGAISDKCIRNAPGLGVLDDRILKVDYYVMVKSSLYSHLVRGNPAIVDGEAFVVEDPPSPIEDGVFSAIGLEKVDGPVSLTIILDGDPSDDPITEQTDPPVLILDGNPP